MPRKRKLSPKRAEQLVFKKHKFSDAKVQRTEKRKSKEKTVQPMNVNYLVNKLKDFAPNAAFLYSDVNFLKKETSVQEQPGQHFPTLHNINFIYNTNVDLKSDICKQHFRSYFYSLQLSEQDCAKIEKRTRGQSKNDMWFEARNGRITSSMFGSIYKQKVSTLPDNLLKSVLGYSDFTSRSVQWGSSHEAAARRVYAKQIQKKHPKLRTYSVGLIVSPNFPHLGCSPDGYLECEHCDDKNGVLEIKCPYKWRFLTPYEAANDKSFFCELKDDKVVLKRSHSYFYQVQGQMAISGRNWCDFFVWTLRGFSVERIHFEPDLWRDISAKLNHFYLNAVVPELFSLRVKRGVSEHL